MLENDPKMTITKLQAGIDTRKSISEVDVKFASNNYLKHIKIREQRKIYNSIQGSNKAFDSLDTTFEFIRQLVADDNDVIKEWQMESKKSIRKL